MGAMLGRIISDYRSLVETCQQRAVELGISRLEIDRLSGLTSGYSGKILGSGDSKRPKRMWPVGLEAILGTLGLKLLLIEDDAATARTLALRTPVTSSHQRFGNKSNCKPSLKLEHAEDVAAGDDPTYGVNEPVSSAPAPPPASRAHLRLVRAKRGGKYG